MNRELTIRDMEYLRDTMARRARTYNGLAWKAACGRIPDGPTKWRCLRNEAMKKARHFAKVIKAMSTQ